MGEDQIPGTDPIAETVRLYQDLVQYKMPDDADEIRARYDPLIGYMLEHFGDGPCSRDDVRSYFQDLVSSDPPSVERLESIVRGLIPIAVLRYLFTVVPPSPFDLSPNFRKLVKLYGERLFP